MIIVKTNNMVIYCRVINLPQLGGLNQLFYSPSWFLWARKSRTAHLGGSGSGSHEAEVRWRLLLEQHETGAAGNGRASLSLHTVSGALCVISSRVIVQASWRHGGLRTVSLLTWQLRLPARMFQLTKWKLHHVLWLSVRSYRCYFCCISLAVSKPQAHQIQGERTQTLSLNERSVKVTQ